MATNNSINNPVTGTNTGDETTATIKTKLSITTLSGSNTGDQTTTAGLTNTTDKNLVTDAQLVVINNTQKVITSGTASPTGGSDGDIYLQYV